MRITASTLSVTEAGKPSGEFPAFGATVVAVAEVKAPVLEALVVVDGETTAPAPA